MLNAVELFAGCGGLSWGAHALGVQPLGLEIDSAACRTRLANGLPTMQADVAALDPAMFDSIGGGLILAAPPCPTFSIGGQGAGRAAMDDVVAALLAYGSDTKLPDYVDRQTALVVEPLRWARALKPRWIVLEQVPTVLPAWKATADALDRLGYHTWTDILSSECYGIPQVRKRAILIASLDHQPQRPKPTHQAYGGKPDTYVGEGLPWRSMQSALGWGFTDRPALTIAGTSGGGGPKPMGGGSGARAAVLKAIERGAWAPGPSITKSGHISGVTIEEVAKLQGFAPGLVWCGTEREKHSQIGNAVPPPMAEAIIKEAIAPDRGRRSNHGASHHRAQGASVQARPTLRQVQ